MKILIETYGCSANVAEGEIMAGLLKARGHEIVYNIGDSNVVIINTCMVKATTEQKIFFKIGEVQNKYPDKKLIIAGCMPEGAYERVKKIAPNASMVSTHQITKIVQVVEKKSRAEALGRSDEIKLCLPKVRTNPLIDIVPISVGCNGACTYCAVKIAKGKLVSFPKGKVLDEISGAVKDGCKEIWITSQDTASYGMDKNAESQLPDLLNKISKIDGDFSVRIGMMNPNNIKNILPDILESYNNKKIYKFFHIPIQSGDDSILKSMNRFYSVSEFKDIIETIRKAFHCQIWTDVIIGYPDETEEQFQNTLNILKKLKFDYVNVSRYAMRPGTAAEKLKQLPTKEMKRRTKIASELVDDIVLDKNREWIDWRGEVLIIERGKEKNQWIGRNYAYKLVIVESEDDILGKRINVKIKDALHTGLIGKIL